MRAGLALLTAVLAAVRAAVLAPHAVHAGVASAAGPTPPAGASTSLAAPAHPAPAAAFPVTVRDDRGQALTLAAAPQRIVTLLPSLTETVCALHACARLVGTDRWSDWPASAAALPKLGGLDDAQLERIVALKPDLVLAAVSSRVIERLEALGLRVLALEAKTLPDTRRVLGTVGAALGQAPAAEALWRQLQQRLDGAARRVPAGWRGQKAYFEVATTPYAAGEASFIGELLARLGLGNIVPASMGPFPKLNPEFVVRAQPALVLASQANAAGMAARPGWSQLKALQAGRLCAFASAPYEVMVRPGPRLAEAAEHLADCLQKVAPP